MSTTQLTSFAGVLLSLAFAYLPGVNSWYQALSGEVKRLLMLGLLTVTAAGAFGLSCAGFGQNVGLSLVCDQGGMFGLLQTLLTALAANQATYLLAVRK